MTSNKIYQPSTKTLYKYAQLLVEFALNSGRGVQPGEVVECAVPDVAKPLAKQLHRVILEQKAQPIIKLLPTEFDADFFELANDEQLTFFPQKYLKQKAAMLDHQIGIIATVDPYELTNIEPDKILKARNARKAYRDWLVEKETSGTFTWTIGLWATPAKAKVVGLSLKAYWQQIIKACYLDKADPIAEWKRIAAGQQRVKQALDDLEIDSLHITGDDVDLIVKIGAERKWNGGSGRNIPSFEIFTSPDWRGTQGWIYFNQTLYRYGNVIEGIRLEFVNGKVVKATAKKGEKFLQKMLETENADKLGEFSLTDKRYSRINHVMAETLFDENMGGPFGNMHVALGMAYKDCYKGDPKAVKPAEWIKMGYNDSAEHTDIITTTDRTVTATTIRGETVVIYQDGKFVV